MMDSYSRKPTQVKRKNAAVTNQKTNHSPTPTSKGQGKMKPRMDTDEHGWEKVN